ncbi:hypothetical protein SODALDRAFT_351650 [Sodiomyces alkalinus F11]|uniref:HCNGP-domain-containing protein n=1 Tax=Sodiomyces alkalinus (strain CBS 110278 / VKM F-3762 / F11) TaxID=1314773 RepID=A0A3N2PSE1_SODAK|nr:hypothetical protein SODALDRAFT_351650 [Sodiomyces alkalinus F11]ROT37344.1 hypothetical protein SODALDRAFT_351650 [Sodiomyces alkalinus F11]
MAGLVEYASDEDEEVTEVAPKPLADVKAPGPKASAPDQPPSSRQAQETAASQEAAPAPVSKSTEKPAIIGPMPQHSGPLGPSLPPGNVPYLPEPEEELPSRPDAPSSPYSANRALLRHLTLPTYPDLDIPPSPPGSPPPGLNEKFDKFLHLKKKDVHFNSKLANSSALRNPSLMDKLMDFVELGSEEGSGGDVNFRRQYVTTLSPDVWDPTGPAFPDWAFRGPLKKNQEKIRQERMAEKTGGKRSGIDFVPPVTASSGSGRISEVGGLSRGSKRKASGQ